jgi:predicted aspartyl protease
MGTFYTRCIVENHADRERRAKIAKILVDTGSEYTWISQTILERIGVAQEKKDLAFVMANGQRVTRSVGFAIIRVGDSFTIDEVVFANPGDLLLLGARTLEGLNLIVDTQRKKLVAAGPIPAATTRHSTRRFLRSKASGRT